MKPHFKPLTHYLQLTILTHQNDVEAGDIIPGMPEHKINANITYGLFDDFLVKGGLTGATGVYLRGDESNQLNKTSPYAVFNLVRILT